MVSNNLTHESSEMPRHQLDWESLYKEEKVENLQWCCEQLDTDLKKDLKLRLSNMNYFWTWELAWYAGCCSLVAVF